MANRGVRIRVLVVEDEETWRNALCGIFESMPGINAEIGLATSETDAVRSLLQGGRWDLLVLDILLGAGNGQTVLRKAKERDACRGVIVVTGMHQNEEILFREGGAAIRVTLVDYLGRQFPSRSRCFLKEKSLSLEQNLAIIRDELTPAGVLSLCGLVNSFTREGDVWAISWGGATGRFGHLIGFEHIQRLLRRQGEVLSLGDLLPADPERLAAVRFDPDAGKSIADLRRAGEAITQLQDELRAAEERGDGVAASRIESAIAQIVEWLDAPGGREHPILKRARDRVSKATKRAVAQIRLQLPELGAHLESSLRLGKTLSYIPPARTDWTLD